MNSEEKSFPLMTQQLAGTESINITRLLTLNSMQAGVRFSDSNMDLGWVIPKSHKRSYLQQRVMLQKMDIWHVFKSVPQDTEIVVKATDGELTRVPIFKGNWTHDAIAAYLTTNLKTAGAPSTSGGARQAITVSYDPYQLSFVFCPSIALDASSTGNKYLGFSDGAVASTSTSAFPPVILKGPTCINVFVNLTINNIPVSNFLTCIPIYVGYGSHIHYENNDSSQASLALDQDIRFIRLTLRDEYGNLLEYPKELMWEAQLGLQPTVPDGFSPLVV